MKGQTTRAEKIAKTVKVGGTVVSIISLIKTTGVAIILILSALSLMAMGLPNYIGIPMIIIAIALVVIEIIRMKRIASADLASASFPESKMVAQNERIINYIAGIMRTGLGLRGVEVLGAGKVIDSENAMIITDKRVIFITVPLAGAETLLAGTDIPMWQWLVAKKDIDSKAKEAIDTLSIEDILNSTPKNFFVSYDEIEKVTFSKLSRSMKVIKRKGKSLTYSIRDKNDFEKAKSIFGKFL